MQRLQLPDGLSMLNFFKSRSSKKLASQGKLAVAQVQPPPQAQPPVDLSAGEVDISVPHDLPKVSLEDFDLLKVLGKGGFGKVMLVRKKGTNDIYAMKVLKKEAVIRRNQVAHTKTETHILKQIRHPFLTRMFFGVRRVTPSARAPSRPRAISSLAHSTPSS